MTYIITRETIELNFSLYKIIFPNNDSLRFVFTDERKSVGNFKKQIGLKLYSKEKAFEPGYGQILELFRNLGLGGGDAVPGYFYGLEDIELFLAKAKENNYNVDSIIKEFLAAKNEKITFFGL